MPPSAQGRGWRRDPRHAARQHREAPVRRRAPQGLQYVQDIAGGLLVTYPAPEDLDHPEYGRALERYLEGAGGASRSDRLRVINMISDLTSGEYGGYQAVLAIHAEGSIEAEKLTILAQYDRDRVLVTLAGSADWIPGVAAVSPSTSSN